MRTGDFITVKVSGGLHARVQKWVSVFGVEYTTVSLFRKGRGRFASSVEVACIVGDDGRKPKLKSKHQNVCELVLDGAFIELPDDSAQKVAAFLGTTVE